MTNFKESDKVKTFLTSLFILSSNEATSGRIANPLTKSNLPYDHSFLFSNPSAVGFLKKFSLINLFYTFPLIFLATRII